MTAWELFYLITGLSFGYCVNGQWAEMKAMWRERHRYSPPKGRVRGTKSHWV